MGQSSSQPYSSTTTRPCPVDHTFITYSETENVLSNDTSSLARCPVQHTPDSEIPPAQCPVQHSDSLNPLNQMPTLSQQQSPHQQIALPLERTVSSIPRPSDDPSGLQSRKWDYPSPQQFYNALVRKGWETPEEHVETMVEIHNFLNEKAWEEVLWWEGRREKTTDAEPELARFMGRPQTFSPKARFWLAAGWLLPSRFNTEPPFDRHDWVIRRPSTQEEVRYVIDYYSAPPEPDGSPVFSLDVRPALDSWGSLKDRVSAATEDVWKSLREREQHQSVQNTNAGARQGG